MYSTMINLILNELTLTYVNHKYEKTLYRTTIPLLEAFPTKNKENIDYLMNIITEILEEDLNGFDDWKITLVTHKNKDYLGIAHNQCFYTAAIEEMKKIYNERKKEETFLIGTIDITKFYKGNEKYQVLIKRFKETIETGNEWAFSTATDENNKQYLCMIREDDEYELQAIKEQEKLLADLELRLQFEK